uniref:Uncharacterized protein n=1 Tax=Proboscia inermis TaxID=420281 RepID=A0A7S0CIA6_9STRA
MKIVRLLMQIFSWQEARESLYRILTIQRLHYDKGHDLVEDTKELIRKVDYQILNFPTITDAISMGITQNIRNPFNDKCIKVSFLGPLSEDIKELQMELEPPENCSKLSGHKVSYA